MGRIYDELPCGCYVSTEGGGGLISCCHPEIGDIPTEIHKECMRLYFDKNLTPYEVNIMIEVWKKKNRQLHLYKITSWRCSRPSIRVWAKDEDNATRIAKNYLRNIFIQASTIYEIEYTALFWSIVLHRYDIEEIEGLYPIIEE